MPATKVALPATIGRYEILERLGEGGMGSVYLGRDPHIGRLIAVKVLHGHLRDQSLHQRFLQEARSAGALAHPNIVTVHDFGEVDDAPYLVMEYVRGQQVASVIKRREPLPLTTKLEWLEGLCAGLHYAHESKIIHRDVKPQNLMIDERGTLKILDFGIARVAESGLTKMSMVIGTPGYMSPEQIDSRSIDRRSDIFSVGAVAYALVSYREAFEGDSVASVMHRVMTVDPPPLIDLCAGLPRAVADLVARALSKAPSDRFQTAGEMQRAIAAARLSLPADAPEPAPAASRVPALPERSTPASRTPAEFRRRRLEQIERHLRDAEDALARRDVAAAIASVEAALVLDPEHSGAQRLLHFANEPHTASFKTEATEVRPALQEAPAPSAPDVREALTPSPPLASAPVGLPATPPPRATPSLLADPPPLGPKADAPARALETIPTAPRPPEPRPPRSVPPAPASMREPREPAGVVAASRTVATAPLVAGAIALVGAVAFGVWQMRPVANPMTERPTTATGEQPSSTESAPQTAQEDLRAASDIARLMAAASSAEQSSRWAEARTAYEGVLRLSPEHVAARAGLSRMAARLAPPSSTSAPIVVIPAAASPTPAAPALPTRKVDGPSAEDRVRANGLVRRATGKYEAGDYDGALADLNQALVSVSGHEGASALMKTVLRAKETEAKLPRRPPPGR